MVDENGRRSKAVRKFRKIAEADLDKDSDDPTSIIGEEVAEVLHDVDVVTSEAQNPGWLGKHFPVIDIDVPIYVVPSNGPHRYALFIDHPVRADDYFNLLDALATAGIVEVGFAEVARKRGYSAVRPFWVNKPEKAVMPAAPEPVPSTDPWAAAPGQPF
jgi:hypothetical protein